MRSLLAGVNSTGHTHRNALRQKCVRGSISKSSFSLPNKSFDSIFLVVFKLGSIWGIKTGAAKTLKKEYAERIRQSYKMIKSWKELSLLIERFSSVSRPSFAAEVNFSHIHSYFFKPAIHDLRAGCCGRRKHDNCWIVRLNVLNFIAFFY